MNQQFTAKNLTLECHSRLDRPWKQFGLVFAPMAHIFHQFLEDQFKLNTVTTLELEICGAQKMKKLNQVYRSKEKVTDVLSFPLQEDLRRGQVDQLPMLPLGSVVICWEVMQRQARSFDLELWQELVHLSVHGFLHLCGFDHEISSREEKIMQKYENQLVQEHYRLIKKKDLWNKLSRLS